MTKLEQLIQDLCPNGVKMVKLGDVAKISRGVVLSKSYIADNAGEYPVYSSQTENNGCLGYINTYAYDGDFITWTTDGANAGTVFYRTGKFSITNVCGLIKIENPNICLKFIYYVLSVSAQKYVNRGMGNAKLMSNVMAEIQIPLPPLAVQSEIVRLLDKFTLYKSELAAELAARCKQYEHYRDQLLTFDDTVKRVKLGEVGKMQYGYPFNASLFTDEKNDKPIIRIRDVVPAYANTYYNGNVDDLENYIIRRGDMLVGMDGYFNMAKWNDDNAYLNQRVCKISTANSKVVLDGFLFHFLKPTFKIIEQNTAGGSVIHLSAKVINNILIPLPPLSEQERIVSILDRFDKLCHDIREGLPAEIELRQKQYEYYRDKLLTFG